MYMYIQVTRSFVCAGSRDVGSDLLAIFRVSRLLSFSSPAAAPFSPAAAVFPAPPPEEAGAPEPPQAVMEIAIATARNIARSFCVLFFIALFLSFS